MYSWGVSSVGRTSRLHREGQGFESPTLHHLIISEVICMKKTLTELEIYTEREYIINKYHKKYIKAFYYFLKWKYYTKKNMKNFLTN